MALASTVSEVGRCPKSDFRVLIAEDEPLVAQLLEMILDDAGFSPTAVLSGRDAIRAIEAERNFRLLITDIRVGDPPDGWGVARAARRANPDIRVVYLTGDSMADWPAEGVSGSLLVVKPFTSEQIICAVTSVLARA